MDHAAPMPQTRAIPRPAIVLGWLGVVPFAALSLATVFASAPTAAACGPLLVAYAAIILAFMGGAQWGLAMQAGADDPRALARRLAISVLPALAAFVLAALPGRSALLGLATAFAALLAYDVTTSREGIAPAWYPALRVQLTAAVMLCLLLAASLGRV